jgi:hypothetical protein
MLKIIATIKHLLGDSMSIQALWKNKEWIFSGIGVAVLVWFFAWLTNRKKSKLKLKLSPSVSIVDFGNHLGTNIPLLSATITNAGTHITFLEQPLFFISKKVDGANVIQVIQRDSRVHFSVELSPGQQFSMEYSSLGLEGQILWKLKDRDTICLEVSDTLGKKFYSKKLKVKRIKEHNQLADQS